MNTNGSGFQILHEFFFGNPSNLTDGSSPFGSLALLNSKLYGMTYSGGSAHNAGAIFSFDPALAGGGGGGGSGPTAGVKVTILPATAVKAGAQWQINGGSPNKSGVTVTNLTAGAHVISFTTIPGFTTPAPQIIDLTLGTIFPVTGTYIAADVTKPLLKVVSPTAKTIAITNIFTASGTASDNVGLALVYYQLNSGPWTAADSGNSFTNWTVANLNLTPGVNVMSFYAKDLSGNLSLTNTVSFTYIVTGPVLFNLNIPNAGTFKPNYNGQLLQIGKPYPVSVKAAKGFGFVNWTGSTNTTSPKLTFIMTSNLTFTANFKDITRPVNVILTPTKNQKVTNAVFIATGRAMDNASVEDVLYRVNSGTWAEASSGDGTNWQTANLASQLVDGANTISAYALDVAGNASLTNTIAFNYTIPPSADWAPDSLKGLLASVTPATGSPEAVGFDVSNFSQSSTASSTDPQDYGGGTYTYLKVDTNLAQLSLVFSFPPGNSNVLGPIDLVFTNYYAGYFTNENGGDMGQISFQPRLRPWCLQRQSAKPSPW